ncbi:hypothetical protein K2X89_09490 [Myxococcota bacterium]|nr:hypothetical protein [Myxococcota bacterium]
MRTHLPAAVLLTLSVLLLVGCDGDSGETTTIGDTEITVDEGGGASSITITGNDGEQLANMTTGSGVEWPDSAPAYAPAYPGGSLVSTMAGDTDGKAGAIATFQTSDTPEKVIDFYRERAAAAGLDKVTNMAVPDMTIFAATDASGDTGLSVQVSASDGITTASVTYSEPVQ